MDSCLQFYITLFIINLQGRQSRWLTSISSHQLELNACIKQSRGGSSSSNGRTARANRLTSSCWKNQTPSRSQNMPLPATLLRSLLLLGGFHTFWENKMQLWKQSTLAFAVLATSTALSSQLLFSTPLILITRTRTLFGRMHWRRKWATFALPLKF